MNLPLALATVLGLAIVGVPTIAAADEEPATGLPAPPPTLANPPNAEPVKDVAPRPSNEPIGTQRFLGALTGAAGFITAAVGGFLTLSANTAYSDASSHCRKHCTQEDVDDGNSAHTRANIGGVVFIAGLAVLGGGIALWFTAPKAVKATADTSTVRVGITPSLGGLSAVGTF